MAMDGGVSAFGSIFNASWKIATVVYELKAVGEQTRDLLDTTSQVSSTLQHAQVLRRQRSGLLNSTEKKWIDDVLQASERAVGNVAALIEPARVDMQTNFSKIKLLTRSQFILRDSPKVQVQLGRLGIAAQGLNTAMGVLCHRDGSVSSVKTPTEGGALKKADSGASENELKPPPSYEVVELLDRRRESLLKRRASKLPMNNDEEMNKAAMSDGDPISDPMVNVNVTEVQPTPMTSPQPDHDKYAGSDGLQVVENQWSQPIPGADGMQVVENQWSKPGTGADGLQVVDNYPSRPDPSSRSPPVSLYSSPSTTSLPPAYYQHPVSSSRSPSCQTLNPNTNYFPYTPPPPPPPPPNSWQQQTVYNHPPPLSTSPSVSTLRSQYRPPGPPSPQPPYSFNAPQPNAQIHNANYNPNIYNLPPPASITTSPMSYHPSPNLTACSSDPNPTSNLNLYPRPLSRSSIQTEELSTITPQQHQHQQAQQQTAPRQRGRARGRAWLEHQLER
ncbi:hypothetical protein EPUS_04998 [Endocarpon pusillum Z07020]|uniref:Uncharacterized protein n=1 Tax=Endocarpon pusillum (strain Z07020 / HMAS-L-300199) TaxID=1263415 RepID=U1HNX4_ENDPU|nr:uncharacterized protein EPUS_04998 [Endocarpon pusillum Z07020]ERF72080.1 hypothetical protein EPUS_04998 [Endocarpon pusillum Z07020]